MTDRPHLVPQVVPPQERAPMYAAYRAAHAEAERLGGEVYDDRIIQAAVNAYADQVTQLEQGEGNEAWRATEAAAYIAEGGQGEAGLTGGPNVPGKVTVAAVEAFLADAGANPGAMVVVGRPDWSATGPTILRYLREPSSDRPHIRIRYSTNGAHTHCSVWSVERGGADVTHGCNGGLVFRNAEFEALRKLIELGLDTTDHAMGQSAEVEFVEDPQQVAAAPALNGAEG